MCYFHETFLTCFTFLLCLQYLHFIIVYECVLSNDLTKIMSVFYNYIIPKLTMFFLSLESCNSLTHSWGIIFTKEKWIKYGRNSRWNIEIETGICYGLPNHEAVIFNLNQGKVLGVILRLFLKQSKNIKSLLKNLSVVQKPGSPELAHNERIML